MSKATRRNRATIYSNGIADFQRVYKVTSEKPLAISLPVKEEHLADVLASLTVLGNVRVDSPPGFQPDNHQETNVIINQDDSLIALVKQLTGSAITILGPNKKKTTGTLVGVDLQQQATEGQPCPVRFLVVMSGKAIERIPMDNVLSLQFDDPVVQSEIEKALNRSLRRIKPNSTFVDLHLSTTRARSQAIVQYTVPAAAWKITYRLLQQEEDSFTLQGHAIVDNNTEEDWKDFDIALVIGQPVTFSTDIATRKIPAREHVNLVSDSTVGAVSIDALPECYAAAPPAATEKRSDSRVRTMPLGSISTWEHREELAQIETTEVSETGDFCSFESLAPVSIEAQRSAVIPVFQTDLDEAQAFLHFKSGNHPDRPFRAIRFKNSTGHSLGRGVCTVFLANHYAGSCVLPATKPDDDAFLPHALETGVRVVTHQSAVKRRRVGVKISAGVIIDQTLRTSETRYVVNSSQDQDFQFLLDHEERIPQANVNFVLVRQDADPESLAGQEMANARRCEFLLGDRESLTVTVTESAIAESRIQLVGENWQDGKPNVKWLFANLVETDSPLAENETIRQAMELNRRLGETSDQIAHARSEVERLSKRQERLRKNLKTGGGVNQDDKWRNDLARAEDAIVQLEDERIPELVEQGDMLAKQLYNLLNTLAVEWTD